MDHLPDAERERCIGDLAQRARVNHLEEGSVGRAVEDMAHEESVVLRSAIGRGHKQQLVRKLPRTVEFAERADLRALEDRDARLRALAPDVPPNLAHKLPPSMRPATADAKQLRDARLYAHNAVAAGRPRTASAVHARNSSLRAGLIG